MAERLFILPSWALIMERKNECETSAGGEEADEGGGLEQHAEIAAHFAWHTLAHSTMTRSAFPCVFSATTPRYPRHQDMPVPPDSPTGGIFVSISLNRNCIASTIPVFGSLG